MVSSINNTASIDIQQMLAEMYQKMGVADTDGIAGLSKNELSSATSENNDVSLFLNSLTQQYDALDKDKNGQLSYEEIASVKPSEEPIGPPPGLQLNPNEASETAENSTKKILEAFIKSFSESCTKENTDKTNKAEYLIKTADSDGNSSLSVKELSSIDTSNNTNKAKFINDLIKNFVNYDTNGDGQLSQSELNTAAPKQFSQQELSTMINNHPEKFANLLGSLSGSFVQKLLDHYKNGDFANLISTIKISG